MSALITRLFACILLAALTSACSKEGDIRDTVNNSQRGKNSVYTNTNRYTNPKGDKTTGTITGIVKPPESRAAVFVYNDNFISAPVYIDADGNFSIEGLRASIYTVVIYPLNNLFPKKEINKVEVSAGVITYIGTITL